ncbi:MAG: RDD family protein [Bacteroidetes bacterium]|nr:RDD family protein [Bacteroidota bacterium]MBK7503975.1 RDD family protein [Bacteroidota bacterium]MBK7638947.1 RDD family protein [Bacteroidota bacterium]MBK9355625.1 RDD family protein [Bacteroidota bacterium]MBL0288994.1 RDD family protein [Bacteroidota bacterium]
MQENYPGISERIKAMLTDSIVVVGFIYLASYVFSLFETIPDSVQIIAFVFIFFLYDPIFTSFFGGTIGHMLLGIRVKRESDEQKNIQFHLAIIRYFFKAFLGIISLVTVSGNEKKRAIHDHLIGSVVVYSDAKG